MKSKSLISLYSRKLAFLLVLIICLIAISAVSWESDKAASKGAAKSPEPMTTPVIGSPPKTESNGESRNAVSDKVATEPVKLKCKDAKEKNERLLCETLIPPDFREDAVIARTFEITYSELDLNGDGAKELIAWESSWAGTSGGVLWVLSKRQNGYRKIFEIEMTWSPIILLSSTHGGWRDFAYLETGGGAKQAFITIAHRGKSYKAADSTGEQPQGEVLIDQNWGSSVFGPISN